MSEWEYKIVGISDTECGIFVIRDSEWRLLLTVNSTSLHLYEITGPLPAMEIARAMGWDRDQEKDLLREKRATAILEVAAQMPVVASFPNLRRSAPPLPAKKAAPASSALSTGKRLLWTERAETLLRKYRTDGLSYAVIAKRMTKELGEKFTDSACSAKADRMRLPRIPKPGGRPPKAKIPGPGQEISAAAGLPVAQHNDLDGEPKGLPAPNVSFEEAESFGLINIAQSVLPSVAEIMREPMGGALGEAVAWYRSQGFRVFKIKPAETEQTMIQVNLGDLVLPEKFIQEVNELRQKMELEPFEVAA